MPPKRGRGRGRGRGAGKVAKPARRSRGASKPVEAAIAPADEPSGHQSELPPKPVASGNITLRTKNCISPCVRFAIERLRVHPAISHPAVDVVTSAVKRALYNPASPLASFLLIGGPGSGKSLLASAALHRVREGPDAQDFVEIRLDGLLHGRSVLTFSRAVATCLLEASGGYPVTLADEQDCNRVLIRQREELAKAGKGIVFVVANFELFAPAGSAHSVLYKILDLLQDNSLGCAFVGMTSHHDAADRLEKRVKSRFSPHEIPITGFTDDNLNEVLGFLHAALVLPEKEGVAYAKRACEALQDGNGRESIAPKKLVKEFNSMTKELLESENFRKALWRLLAGDRGVNRLVAGMQDMLLELREGSMTPLGGQFCVETFEKFVGIPFTSSIAVLTGLSRLEITLVVALKRLETVNKARSTSISFADVYEEYMSVLVGGSKGHSATADAGTERIADMSVAIKAWGRLVESDIISLAGSGPSISRAAYLKVHAGDVQRALKEHPNASAFLERWGKGEAGITS